MSSTTGGAPQLFTVRQASAVLGIPERTIRRHLKRGTIQGQQLARQSPWLLPKAEIERVSGILWITPDWEAARLAKVAEVAEVAEKANTNSAPGAAPTLEP